MLALLTAPLLMLAPAERPRDVWVFRSVLDKRARMVTLALHDGLWVAYDATNCGLYKAWDGDVAFEGAVYTAVHGPQPRSVGAAYLQRNPDEAVWYVRQNGQTTKVKPTFKGYRIQEGKAILQYDIPVGGKKPARVDESPEYVAGPNGQVGLERRFRVKDVPKGVEVLVGVPEATIPTGVKDLIDLPLVTLKPNEEVRRVAFFTRKGSTTPTPIRPVERPTPIRVGPPIEVLSVRTRPKADGTMDSIWSSIAPSLVANRYEGGGFNADDLRAEARIAYDAEGMYFWIEVADDVVRGADGVTVSVGGSNGTKTYTFLAADGASRQPEAIYSTKKTPRGYIVEANVPWAVLGKVPAPGEEVPFNLTVTDEDGGAPPTKVSLIQGAPQLGKARLRTSGVSDQPEDRQPREPGLAVRVYWTGVPATKIPKLAASQTPNVSFVSPTIDFNNDTKFGGFGEYFIVHATGFLRVPEAGEYEFVLSSDDGSMLWIDDKVVVDHDGLHGEGEPKTAKVRLEAGDHPIRVEYFENEADEALHLGWKRPGKEDFEVIASEFLSTPRGEVRVTSPGKKLILNAERPNPPGDRRPLEDVHPSYDLATIRPPDFKPRVGGISFLPDGRMVICTWDSDGAVYVLDNVRSNQKGVPTVKRIAAGLAEPLGITVVGKRIFVLQKQELTELIDLNGDDTIDEYRAVANGWGVTDNFHEFAFGLAYKDGFFYGNLATAINPGGSSTRPQNPDRGKSIKIGLDGKYEFVAHGLRTPNGVGLGYRNDVFITDNQGDWLPASKLMHLTKDAFFGNRSVNPEGTAGMKEKPPVVWLPQGEIGNSPSTPLGLNDGPYKGQMVIGDVTYGGLQRVYVEEVDKQLQGSVFRMTQGLEAGINRLAWGPDGALYVGGIGSTGNWGQTGKERFGLQRLKYNGKTTFEMLAVRARTNGFEVEFTEPLMAGNGEDAASYFVDQFRYEPTEQYGGPKLDEKVLPVKSVTLSADRKRAFLELDGLKAGHVVHIRVDSGVRGHSGQSIWSTETWYTLNAIPQNRPGQVDRRQRTMLDAAERRQGFVPLFDGNSTDAWIGYRKDRLPRGWKAVEGVFLYDPKAGDGGDVMTKEEFENFELRMEWKVAPGGNSGLFFRVDDTLDIPWFTGPEIQILDNERHADGKSPKTSAGSNYAMHATDQKAVNPAGQWNEFRVIVRGNDVEQWLNGKRVVAYTLLSPEWEALWKASKFASLKEYGRRKKGHLVLQDHGDPIWFRNIRIKKL